MSNINFIIFFEEKNLLTTNLKNLDDSDYGMGNLFAEAIRSRYRYLGDACSWLKYDSEKWTLMHKNSDRECNGLVNRFKNAFETYANRIYGEEESNYPPKVIKLIKKLRTNSFRKTLIDEAKTALQIGWEQLDSNLRLFNCKNGTLDLETFEFREHNPEDLITKVANVIYNPYAIGERFKKFLEEIMQEDEKLIQYLCIILGSSLDPESYNEEMYIFLGRTCRNGKSTLVETMLFLMGDYGITVNADSIKIQNRSGSQATEDITRLKGTRFVNISEPSEGMRLDASLIKRLTGRDTICGRKLYADRSVEFVFEGKLFLHTNDLPFINDQSIFRSNRIKVIPFERHFNVQEQDPDLKRKLITEEELSGMLNWLLLGLKKFREDQHWVPEEIANLTKEYSSESDKVQMFLEEVCERSDKCDAYLTGHEVFEKYTEWCRQCGLQSEGKVNFFKKLRSKNLLMTIYVNGQPIKNAIRNIKFKFEYMSCSGDLKW